MMPTATMRDNGRSLSRSRSRSRTRSRSRSRSHSHGPRSKRPLSYSPPLTSGSSHRPAAAAPASKRLTASELDRRLTIKRLTKRITRAHLQEIFGCYGAIEDLEILKDAKTGESRGIAHITFAKIEGADAAIAHMDRGLIDDIKVDVLEYDDRSPQTSPEPMSPPPVGRVMDPRDAYSRGSDRRDDYRRGDYGAYPPRGSYRGGYRGAPPIHQGDYGRGHGRDGGYRVDHRPRSDYYDDFDRRPRPGPYPPARRISRSPSPYSKRQRAMPPHARPNADGDMGRPPFRSNGARDFRDYRGPPRYTDARRPSPSYERGGRSPGRRRSSRSVSRTRSRSHSRSPPLRPVAASARY